MSDLTRWNRSGLRRFRYVNGNAVEFLETLRREFADRLPDWNPLVDPSSPKADPDGAEPEPEPERARNREVWAERREERMQKLYARPPTGDLGWEIARSFARASHVLAEHVDAFANEGFLETATQWESVRRLVSRLDYHPAPPASATTFLRLKTKPGSTGRIKAGFAVESVGQSSGSPVVFETLEDIDIDSTLDELKPANANTSPKVFTDVSDVPWLGPRKQIVRADQPVLISCENLMSGEVKQAAAAVKKVSVENGQRRIELTPSAVEQGGCILGTAELSVSPSWDRAPRLNGPDVWHGSFDPNFRDETKKGQVAQPHGLAKGDVVVWKEDETKRDDDANNWVFAKVKKADRWGVIFDKAPPEDKARSPVEIFQAVEVPRKRRVPDGKGGFTEETIDVVLPRFKVARQVADGTQRFGPSNLGLDEIDVEGIDLPLMTLAQAQIWGIPIFPPPFRIPPPWDPALIVMMAKMVLGIGELLEGGSDPKLTPSSNITEVMGLPTQHDSEHPEHPDPPNYPEPEHDNQFIHLNDDDYTLWPDPDSGTEPPSLDESKLPKYLDPAYRLPAGDDTPLLVVPEFSQPPILLKRPDKYTFDGDPGPLGEGEHCVGKMPGNRYVALTIKAVELRSGDAYVPYVPGTRFAAPVDHFKVTFRVQSHLQELEHLYAGFRSAFLPEAYDQNEGVIDWDQCLLLAVPVPEGRRLLLSDDKNSYPVTATPCGENGIRVTPTPPIRIARNELKIYGNVVLAGHGKRRPDRQLSGGPGGSIVRELLFDVRDVSFVSDTSQPGGVRADIEIRIEGELWEQVGSLRTSLPTDPHYTVRVTEQRQIMLGFGDGTHGRRLPGGTNNVHVRYRVGVGAAGNVAAGNLVRALERHPLVEEIHQLQATVGGNDAESVDDVRENGPRSVLTLNRAVSLDDFTHLAASHSSVWHARAFYTPAGDRLTDRVELVVVPAGGGSLGKLREELAEFLTARAVPGVFVRVEAFNPVPVSLAVELRVDDERYQQQQVRSDVETALRDALSLQHRGIARSLPISEVYRIVENVVGVANSRCRFRQDTFATTTVRPDDEFVGARRTDVVYLAPEPRYLTVSSERLTL